MAQGGPGAPRLFERARRLRIEKGLTQRDAGGLIGKSQAYVSLLENGECSIDEEREYLRRLEHRRANRQRTSGGSLKAGRLRTRSGRTVLSSDVRGEPLDPEFDHAATLPQDDRWEILAICRTARDAELAFLRDDRDRFGLVGFHLIDGAVKRGVIVKIEPDHDDEASIALEAFARGNLELEGEAPASRDDGLLADDEAVRHA